MDEYITSDFYTAVILRLKKIPLFQIKKAKGRFVEFSFRSTAEKCQQIKKDYWDRKEELIAIRDITDEIIAIKSMIHEVIRSDSKHAESIIS